MSKVGHVVLVGGGVGVAPVYPQLRAFRNAGNRTTGIIGFRNKDLVFWEERFAAYCDDLVVCTDDGSYGRPGFVTAALQDVIGHDQPDLVIAIGPLLMMHACVETTRPSGVKTMVSLNTIMVDGTGMCGSCRVSVGGEVKFACVDPYQILVSTVVARSAEIHDQPSRSRRRSTVLTLEKTETQKGTHTVKAIFAAIAPVTWPDSNASPWLMAIRTGPTTAATLRPRSRTGFSRAVFNQTFKTYPQAWPASRVLSS